RYPGAQLLLQGANLLGGLREFRAKAPRLPDLKLVTDAGESDLVLDAGMALQRLGEDGPPLAVGLQHFAAPLTRRRELLALLRIRWKASDQRLDFLEQCIAASVERRPVERRIAVEALETVARQDRAEGRRDRDPALGIEAQRIVGHEAVHNVPGSP